MFITRIFSQVSELEQIVSLAKRLQERYLFRNLAAVIWKIEYILYDPIRVKGARASLGKPIVSIEVERRSLVNLCRISVQEYPH